MTHALKLMCVFAHPDDETLGTGGVLAKYAAEGVETYLVAATRGQRGWFGAAEDYPGPQALGKIRERELHEAAQTLGIREVHLFDYMDGELDQSDPDEVTAKIVMYLRQIQPDVVITFDPFGVYGHPDHIAISQFTSAAILHAADPAYQTPDDSQPHHVSKLYYLIAEAAEMAAYQDAFGDLVMTIDGMERRPVTWPTWAVTTRIETAAYARQIWQAVECHRSQLPGYEALQNLAPDQRQALWNTAVFYRAFSLVNGGRHTEHDLFAGLRTGELKPDNIIIRSKS
jgi:LmbE family N-acetylglucosaminyl deacetylase